MGMLAKHASPSRPRKVCRVVVICPLKKADHVCPPLSTNEQVDDKRGSEPNFNIRPSIQVDERAWNTSRPFTS